MYIVEVVYKICLIYIFDNNILRAYDIRGEVGKKLNNIDAERLKYFASSFNKNKKRS